MEKGKTIIVGIVMFFIGVIGTYLIVNFTSEKEPQTIINKQEKEVTVTDLGIADSVEKIYDAVVVVEVHLQGRVIGGGTGFFYKKTKDKAFLLTNYHVVSKGDKIKIILTNGETVDAKVLGSDQYNDVAVLTTDAKYAEKVAEIGNSEKVRLGDTVFTVGAPLNNIYSGSVTRGIISGKDRMIEVNTTGSFWGSDYIMRVIQTDASINSGNSGGPLSNSNGEVIGITSSKLMATGVEGMGFAIPIEDAIEFANIIEKDGKLVRPSLGIGGFEISKLKFFSGDIKVDPNLRTGIVISAVNEGSNAKKAGLEIGDVIIKIDDNVIETMPSLKYYLYKNKVGDSPIFKINRNGKEMDIPVKLNEEK